MSLVIKFYFTFSMFNMFRTLIHPSSGACDFSIVSPHGRVLEFLCGWVAVVSVLQAEACNTDTTPTQPPHRNSNPHRTMNNMTNVVIQQNSRKLRMMDILMSETCWAHKTWNKIASDIKLVFYSSPTLNLVTRWRRMVNFTPLAFYFSVNYPELPVHWMLGGSGCSGETSPVTARIRTPITRKWNYFGSYRLTHIPNISVLSLRQGQTFRLTLRVSSF